MDKLEHTLLAGLWEILLHIELANGLTQYTADTAHGTLPARTILLDTAQYAAQAEGLGTEVVAHHISSPRDNLNLSISLQIVERSLCQNLLYLVDRLGLPHIDPVEGWEA